jgi:hypothetical protein
MAADSMTLQQLLDQVTAAMEFLGPESEVRIATSYRQETDVLGDVSMKVGLDPTARELKDGTLILRATRTDK